jgi:hypothetical protein
LAKFVQRCAKLALEARKNGELLALGGGVWDELLTSDKSIRHQQNLIGRKISILVIRTRSNRVVDLLPLMRLALRCSGKSRRVRSSKVGSL